MTQEQELSTQTINKMRTAMRKKQSFLLTVTGNTSNFTVNLDRVIEFFPDIDYEIALRRFESYNSIYNVTSVNNQFKYFNGTVNRTITIPPGAYEINAINTEIQRQMVLFGDYTSGATGNTFSINISGNVSTLKTVITLANGYTVDFTIANSLINILGFTAQVLNAPYNSSTNIVNIQNFNFILANTDLCIGSYINSTSSQTLFVFSSNPVPAGYKISIEPYDPIYLPVTSYKRNITDFRVWITDENMNPISFNGENITIVFHIQSV